MTRTIPIAVEKLTPETKCGYCPGSKCCTYVTQEIDTPRSMAEFDQLLWQLAHRNVQAYKDEGHWYLVFNTVCTHLQDDGRCGIYADRPQICRDYSNDFCEFDQSAEQDFQLFFPDYQALLDYCRQRFKTWDRRRSAS